MKKAALAPMLAMIPLLLFSSLPNAFAHEELIVGDIKIVGGWVNEPPLLNQFNGMVLIITHNSTDEPITNAVAQLDITVQKGALTKSLDFLPGEEPGTYVAEILPTQVGQYAVVFRGSVAGQEINSQIEIEDVEDTLQFEFPSSEPGSGPITDDIVEQLQQVISDLNAQVDQATVASEEAVESAEAATTAAAELKTSADRAYIFGMVGVGVGVAGIVIGVTALNRGRDKA